MCGIAFVVGTDSRTEDLCTKVTNRIAHRGPDASGFFSSTVGDVTLSLGHRRLAIIDLTPSGAQPMVDPGTGNVIIYNGETYNFRSLRRELEENGFSFKGTSDTEVILYGYRHWGTSVFERLHGMFALAIYDKLQQKLVVARDSIGIKPLYWGESVDGVFACSELEPILATGLAKREIDANALCGLLAYGSVPEPLSLVRGVQMFPPGHFGVLNLNSSNHRFTFTQYWREPSVLSHPTPGEAQSQVKHLLQEAARTHLESDAPLGIFLSGGVDSTALAILASQATQNSLNTLTVSFPGMGNLDESPVAEETARLIGARHTPVVLSDKDVLESVDSWVGHSDQPSLDGLNTFIVSKAAAQSGLKVVWSGLGGDELFAGYSSFRTIPKYYQLTRALANLPASWRQCCAEVLTFRKAFHQRMKAKDIAAHFGDFCAMALYSRRLFSDGEILSSRARNAPECLGNRFLPKDFTLPPLANGKDLVAAMSAVEVAVYMRNTLLRDSDVCGMAHSIELRVPLLHTPLLEYVMSLPSSIRMEAGPYNKPLMVSSIDHPRLRQVAAMSKRGFSLPYGNWLRGPFRELLEEGVRTLAQSGLLDENWVRQYWQSAMNNATVPWNRPWLLGVLGLWLKRNA